MNYFNYCESLVAPPGSDLYYSLYHSDDAQKQVAIILYAFAKIIQDIATSSHNHAIVTNKFIWWQHEIEGILRQPNHPISHALLIIWEQAALSEELLLGWIIRAQQLYFHSHPDFASWQRIVNTQPGAFNFIASHFFAHQDLQTLVVIQDIDIVIEMITAISHLKKVSQADLITLPADELATFAVTPEMLSGYETTPQLLNFLNFQTTRLESLYQKIMQCFPNIDRYRQLPQLIQLELSMALLKELQRAHFPILKQKISLTPLRKFFISRRIQRREKKYKS